MNPIDLHTGFPPASPCGPSLEYDSGYLLLLARLEPQTEVQYGDFVEAPEPPDWHAIECEAERLLARSIDIALLVCQCRAATRLRQAGGLAVSLQRLEGVLNAWPEAVHPRLWAEGVYDPIVRANALAALADPQGLVGDIAALLAKPDDEFARAALARAAGHAQAIDRWASATLGDQAPDLGPLLSLLVPFGTPATPTVPELSPVGSPAMEADDRSIAIAVTAEVPVRAAADASRSRADMRAVLADARQWFETHEPSSPVALLLEHAESMVGLRWSQLTQAMPAEWLSRLSATSPAGLPVGPQAAS